MSPVLERESAVAVWDGTAPLTCTARRDEAPGTVTFSLAPADGSAIAHGPGQCVTLLWDMPGGTAPRTFTIATPLTRGPGIEITVRRSAGGATADMHERLVPGMAVEARGPAGGFGPVHDGLPEDAPLLLIGAGSGATPAMAHLRHMRDSGAATDVVYVHVASTPADLLFAAELDGLARAMPSLTVLFVVSRVPPGEAWMGPRGRLDRRLLNALVPDLRSRHAYLCGPTGFMDAVRLALRTSGVARDRVREERFHSAEAAERAVANDAATGEIVGTARLRRRGANVPLRAGASLAASLRAAGVVVPTGCRQGLCGTCRVARSSGEAAMRHRGGLTPAQEAAGDLLACCAIPSGDLELDL